MSSSIRRTLCATAVVCAVATLRAATLHAQEVGYDPDRSPYTDIDEHHAFSLFGGYWLAGKDAAGVGPRSGPIVGVRYDVLLGKTPLFFMARASRVIDDRAILDPTRPSSIRVITPDAPASLNIIDAGMGLQLPGHKTFHHLAPVINVGVGGVSDLGGAGGPGRYHFGTQFAAISGAGVRWIPGGWLSRLTLRVDASKYLFEYHYPKSFHDVTADGTSLLPADKPLVSWRNNTALSLGVWYAVSR